MNKENFEELGVCIFFSVMKFIWNEGNYVEENTKRVRQNFKSLNC